MWIWNVLQLLNRVFLTPDEDIFDCGVVSCQFYRFGEWVTVTTDTKVPFGDPSREEWNMPIYGRCSDKRETWVPLLEKCYAKLLGSYEHLHGGRVTDALVDMTGGVAEQVLFTDSRVKALVASGKMWAKMKSYVYIYSHICRYMVSCMKAVLITLVLICVWMCVFVCIYVYA